MQALQDKIDSISAGYGGMGGRAHMVLGRVVTDLVRRRKASVHWLDGESPIPPLAPQFVGLPDIYIYMCVYVYMYMYVCVYMYMYMYIYI